MEEQRVFLKPKMDVIQNIGTDEAAELDLGAELTEVMGEEIYDILFGEKVRNHARRCRWCLKGGLLWIRENCPTWSKLVEFKPENITRDMLIRLTSSAANFPMHDPRKGAAARLNFLRRIEYHSKTCTKCYKDGKFKVVRWCSDWNEVLGHKPDDVSNFDALSSAYTAAGYTQADTVFQDGSLGLDYFLDGSEEDEIQTLRGDAEYRKNIPMNQILSNLPVQCNTELATSMFQLVVCNPDPEPTDGLSGPVEEELQSHDKLCEVCLGGERLDSYCEWWWDIKRRMVAVARVARNVDATSKSPVPINGGVSLNSVMPLKGNLSQVPMQEYSRSKIYTLINGNVSRARLDSGGEANKGVGSISKAPITDNASLDSGASTVESEGSGSDGGVPILEYKSEVRIGNVSGLLRTDSNVQRKHDYIFPRFTSDIPG